MNTDECRYYSSAVMIFRIGSKLSRATQDSL